MGDETSRPFHFRQDEQNKEKRENQEKTLNWQFENELSDFFFLL